MEQELSWATLWVDSIDRLGWTERIKQVFDLPGVSELESEKSGEVRIGYDPDQITIFQLSAHLRASGL